MTSIPALIASILAFVPALVLHEWAHGFAAYKLGDPTAKSAGRLTLNPMAHIDPFGTVILPGLMMLIGGPVFGYAKPVPYNPRYFKDKRKGDLIVGLAGPCANLVLALLGALVAWVLMPSLVGGYVSSGFGSASMSTSQSVLMFIMTTFLPMFVMINLYLMFFNLLPIPPLDGSSIFAVLLPSKYLPKYYQVQQYAMPILLLLLFIVPSVLPFNPISWYLHVTAGNLGNLIFPFRLA